MLRKELTKIINKINNNRQYVNKFNDIENFVKLALVVELGLNNKFELDAMSLINGCPELKVLYDFLLIENMKEEIDVIFDEMRLNNVYVSKNGTVDYKKLYTLSQIEKENNIKITTVKSYLKELKEAEKINYIKHFTRYSIYELVKKKDLYVVEDGKTTKVLTRGMIFDKYCTKIKENNE